MKVIVPKRKPLTCDEYMTLVDALTNVKCCKCGEVIEVLSVAYATMHFDKKRYENRLCDKCKESEGEG